MSRVRGFSLILKKSPTTVRIELVVKELKKTSTLPIKPETLTTKFRNIGNRRSFSKSTEGAFEVCPSAKRNHGLQLGSENHWKWVSHNQPSYVNVINHRQEASQVGKKKQKYKVLKLENSLTDSPVNRRTIVTILN